MEVLVYGFCRGPGELPEIMNVAAGSVRLKFRGLAEQPCFSHHDAVLLPFDTYYPWMETSENGSVEQAQVRARVEVLRAAAAGVTVAFVYEDCFAHFRDQADLAAHSLGAMVMADLGLKPLPLAGPEDVLEVLAPAFQQYLDRYGIAESYLETTAGARPRLHPLCRTSSHRLTGVAAREGKGNVLFLPGDPGKHFLDFFHSAGEAVRRFGGMPLGSDHLFDAERKLLAEWRSSLQRVERLEGALEEYRRRRELLALVPSDPDRLLPEWFADFLGIELQATGSEGLFHVMSSVDETVPPLGLLGLAAGTPGDSLVALEEALQEEMDQDHLTDEARCFLYLPNGGKESRRIGAQTGFDLEAEAREAKITILRPVDLLHVLDEKDRSGQKSVSLDDLLRLTASPGTGAAAAAETPGDAAGDVGEPAV